MKQGNTFKLPPKAPVIPVQIGIKSNLDALVDSCISPAATEPTTLGTDKKEEKKQVDTTQLNRGRLGIGATVNPTLLSDISLQEQLKKRFQKRNRDGNIDEDEDNANSEDESKISVLSKKAKTNQPVVPVTHFLKKKKKKKKKKPSSVDSQNATG